LKDWIKKLAPYLRIVASVLLLWLALRGVDWQTLRDAKIQISPGWFLLAVSVMLCAMLIAALRWVWLAQSAGVALRWQTFVGLYFSGALINQGLPTMLGGDSYRVIEAHRLSSKNSDGLPSKVTSLQQPVDMDHAPAKLRLGFFIVALDRGLGFVGNNIVGAMGLILAGLMITPWAVKIGIAVLSAMLGGTLIAALLLGWSPTRKVITSLLAKIKMSAGLPALDVALGWPRVLAQLCIATVIHLCSIVALGLCFRAYGANVPLEALMVALPALGLLMLLPISISGWGLRESTLAAALSLWNIDPTITLLSSVSFGLASLLATLPGAIVLLQQKNSAKT
jgi:uncharacterized membrane protein YbhN (UPF0104 family)